MRHPWIVALALSVSLGHASASESEVFVIPNQADGYGIDRCLAGGERCGAAMAKAFCRNRAYVSAVSYRKADPQVVAARLSDAACTSGACPEFVAITCEK